MGLTVRQHRQSRKFFLDATVDRANTYATLRARVAGNIRAAGVCCANGKPDAKCPSCAGWIGPMRTTSDQI